MYLSERHTDYFFASSSFEGDEKKQGRAKKRVRNYQYKYQGQERQNELNLNWDSFKWRNYDYAIGRFMSVDPLSEKYAYQSHYNFSENRVIDAVELEGLESVDFKEKDGYKNLIITNLGYDGIDRSSGNTLQYSSDNGLSTIYSSGSSLASLTYSSSATDSSKDDILGSINSFRDAHPDGQIILIGHSGGADNLVELVKENKDIKINLLITLDSRDPKTTGWTDTNIPSNVENAINYYQDQDKLNLISDRQMDFSGSTNGVNILSPGSNHRSIDNDQLSNVVSDINNQLKGKDAVKIARERVQKTHNPADSNSKPIPKTRDLTN